MQELRKISALNYAPNEVILPGFQYNFENNI